METTLNVLFVMTGTGQKFSDICENLTIGKAVLIKFITETIKEVLKKFLFPPYTIYLNYVTYKTAKSIVSEREEKRQIRQFEM